MFAFPSETGGSTSDSLPSKVLCNYLEFIVVVVVVNKSQDHCFLLLLFFVLELSLHSLHPGSLRT